MPSRFNTDAAGTLWDTQLETFGETVTYTPKASEIPQVDVDAIIDRSEYRITDEEWKSGIKRKARVSIAKTDVDSPVLGDAVAFDSATWYATMIEENEIHVIHVVNYVLGAQEPQGAILEH